MKYLINKRIIAAFVMFSIVSVLHAKKAAIETVEKTVEKVVEYHEKRIANQRRKITELQDTVDKNNKSIKIDVHISLTVKILKYKIKLLTIFN